MASTVNIKRESIDLPVDVLHKLSQVAVAQGKSLKSYLESVLISKANALAEEADGNPSPSHDEWFGNSRNTEELMQSISQQKDGRVKAYSMDEIKDVLGL